MEANARQEGGDEQDLENREAAQECLPEETPFSVRHPFSHHSSPDNLSLHPQVSPYPIHNNQLREWPENYHQSP